MPMMLPYETMAQIHKVDVHHQQVSSQSGAKHHGDADVLDNARKVSDIQFH